MPRAGPVLALRIAYTAGEDSGAPPCPFATGDEVAVARLDRVRGWEPLGWRQESSAKQRASADGGGRLAWPQGPRFAAAQRFWGARIVASDGDDGFEEHWCILQAAVSPVDRELESIKPMVEDAVTVASYARRFNMQVASTLGEELDPSEMPGVRVCIPVVAEVLAGTLPDIAEPGEMVTLTVYPCQEVRKFVFDGSEDFLELPQAFFHYVSWASGGRELVADVQGFQDDTGVTLIDPVLLRDSAYSTTISDLLGVVVGTQASAQQGGFMEQRFATWHPRCGQLCKGFDPHRRSIHMRRHCGLSAPTCGVQAGG